MVILSPYLEHISLWMTFPFYMSFFVSVQSLVKPLTSISTHELCSFEDPPPSARLTFWAASQTFILVLLALFTPSITWDIWHSRTSLARPISLPQPSSRKLVTLDALSASFLHKGGATKLALYSLLCFKWMEGPKELWI